MSISSHPSEETLLRHAAGTLPAGSRLVVDVHLAGCPECRALLRDLEAVGGTLLEQASPLALLPGALERALAGLDLRQRVSAGLDAPEPPRRIAPVPAFNLPDGVVLPPGVAWPAPLAARRIGALRPVAPGVRVGRVYVPEDPAANVLLFRLGPGRRIPEHTHVGMEFTHVISGAFSDPLGHYGPGDLVEADADIEHTPLVDADAECICIAAFEGRLRFRGLLGVALRPFL